MSKFSFRNSWKHPVATALAVAAVSYFGSISTALAGKPGPDFLYAPYFHLRNLVSRMARLNAPARRGYLGLFLAALVASPLFVMSDHALAWQTEIDGTANSFDRVNSVAVDAAGDVIAGGSISNFGTGFDFAVVKLDGASGAELWRTEIDTANSTDQVFSVAVDAAGDVIAGGSISNIGTGSNFVVVKLDGVNGAELWRTEIDGAANARDSAFTVAVDADGNVIAGGGISNSGTGLDFTGLDFAVVKLDGADGSELIGTPPFLAAALVDTVVALNLQMGIANSLDAKLGAVDNALDDVIANNDVAAINALQAFINAITAQSGNTIGEVDAAALIASAEQIIALLSGG